jgi:hypothetical protein
MEIKKLSDIEFKNLKFMKTNGKKKDNINYLILDNAKKITISLKNINIPFGVELYKNKKVINIEINDKDSNDLYNECIEILSFEKYLSEKKFNNQFNITNDVMEKQYYHNIRQSLKGYIIRCYIENAKIYTIQNDYEILINDDCLKNTKCDVILELGNLWINEINYGIIWYIKEIQIKS